MFGQFTCRPARQQSTPTHDIGTSPLRRRAPRTKEQSNIRTLRGVRAGAGWNTSVLAGRREGARPCREMEEDAGVLMCGEKIAGQRLLCLGFRYPTGWHPSPPATAKTHSPAGPAGALPLPSRATPAGSALQLPAQHCRCGWRQLLQPQLASVLQGWQSWAVRQLPPQRWPRCRYRQPAAACQPAAGRPAWRQRLHGSPLQTEAADRQGYCLPLRPLLLAAGLARPLGLGLRLGVRLARERLLHAVQHRQNHQSHHHCCHPQ